MSFIRLLFFLLFTMQAVSASPVTRMYTTEDGLPSTFVKHVNQLPSGLIVISTDDGLTFFDGYDFHTRTISDGLPVNLVKQTVVDDRGRLIIATDRGVAITNTNSGQIPTTFTVPSFAPADNNYRIRALFKLQNGHILLAGEQYIYRMDENDHIHKIPFAFDSKRQSDFVRSFAFQKDKNDGILITSINNNLLYLPPGGNQIQKVPDTGLPDNLRMIKQHTEDSFWIGTGSGLYSMEWNAQNRLVSQIKKINAEQNFEIDNMACYNDDYCLIGTNGRGLLSLNIHSLETSLYREFFSNFIKHVYLDRNNNKWISTDHGIEFIPNAPFGNIEPDDGLPRRFVTGVIRDLEENVWVSTLDGLFFRPSESDDFQKLAYLDQGFVKTIIYNQENQDIYAFTTNEIHQIDLRTQSGKLIYAFDSSLDISNAAITGSGVIWVVDNSGELWKRDKNTQNVTRFGRDNGVISDIYGISITDDGLVWVSGENGFLAWYNQDEKQFNKVDWQQYSNSSISDTRLMYIHSCESHYLWIGGENILYHFDPFSDETIGNVTIDGTTSWIRSSGKKVWIGTNRQLYLVHNDENDSIQYVRRFSNSIGLASTNFSYGAAFIDHTGNMWMGTNAGVSYYKGGEIITKSSPVYLRSLKIGDDVFTSADIGTLPHDANQLTFSFTTFDYPADDVTYQARILGSTKGWSTPTTSAEFSQFFYGSGRYIFEVRASRNSTEWSEPLQLSFVIPRPWWFGNVMIGVYLLSVILAIIAIVNWRSASLRRHNKELLDNVRQRTDHLSLTVKKLENEITYRKQIEKELQESNFTKERLIKIISHDLRSPFQGIVGYASMLRDNFDDLPDDERKEMITQVIQSTQRAVTLLNNMLDWTRLQSGQVPFEKQEVEVLSVVNNVIELLNSMASSKKITITNNVEAGITVISDKNMLQSIIQNLVSNALKFTNPGGNVTLNAELLTQEQQGSIAAIHITDNGVGMDQDTLEKILAREKSVSTRGTDKESGSGLGLVICKEMVDRNDGKLTGESKPGEGTTFIITLPAKI